MWLGKDVDLFVLFIQGDLQLFCFRFQHADAFLERFGVSSGKGSPAQLVARSALEAHVRTLGAARTDAITANLLAPTPITRLGDPALRASPVVNQFHGKRGKYAWHGDHICERSTNERRLERRGLSKKMTKVFI